MNSTLGGKERNTHQRSGFSRGYPRQRFLSHATRSTDEETPYLGCLGAAESKTEVSSSWQHQRPCNTAKGNWHSSLQLGTRAQFTASPLLEKGTVKHTSHNPAFQKPAWGTGFCLTWLRTLMELAYIRYLGGRENKRELSGSLRTSINTDTSGIKR